MLLSRRRKFLFIHIFKTAGTSVTRALTRHAAPWPQRAAAPAMKRVRLPCPVSWDPAPLSDHISAADALVALGREAFDAHFSFAFVRNPWDWQASLYAYALRLPEHPEHTLFKSFAGFGDYVRWRCDQNVWLQRSFVDSAAGDQLVNFVGRFETLDDDFRAICQRIGIQATLPKTNASQTSDYRALYDTTSVELVRHAFAADIERFGYDFDGSVTVRPGLRRGA